MVVSPAVIPVPPAASIPSVASTDPVAHHRNLRRSPTMTSTVIVAGARTPDGSLQRRPRLGQRHRPRRRRDPRRARRSPASPAGRRRLRDHGPGAAGRCRPDPGPSGGGRRRHRDGRPGGHHQQGVSVRSGRHRPGRPTDPGRRVRRRGGRRHGVDDPRTAPAARIAGRLQVRRRHPGRSPRRTTACTTSSPTCRWAS